MKNLILLAWEFPPLITGGVYRPLSLVKYAAEREQFEIFVITGSQPNNPNDAGKYLLKQIPENIQIIPIESDKSQKNLIGKIGEKLFLLKELCKLLFYCKNSLLAFHTIFKKAPKLNGGLGNVIKTFLVVKKSFRDNPPDLVMASGPPFHNFVTAYLIARYYQAKLILEYRDEWTECPFDFVNIGSCDRPWEVECLKESDLVIFTTKSMMKHQLKVFSDLDPHKCCVIRNGWDHEDYEKANQIEKTNIFLNDRFNDKLIIAFIGHLFSHNLPEPFLKTLEKLFQNNPDFKEKLKLFFIGNKSPKALQQIASFTDNQIIENITQIPKPEAMKLMQESSALLLFNSHDLGRYIPGKLYDYLAAKTPIIVHGQGGEIESIVTELNAGFIIPWGDSEALANAFKKIQEGWQPTEEDLAKRDVWLNEHTRKNLALKTLEIIESI